MGLFENILDKVAPLSEEDREFYGHSSRPIPKSQPFVENKSINDEKVAITVKIVKPSNFEAVADVADLLLAGNAVLLDFEDATQELTRRFIDFITGVAYAIRGDVRRITKGTFVIAPNGVKISNDQELELSDASSVESGCE